MAAIDELSMAAVAVIFRAALVTAGAAASDIARKAVINLLSNPTPGSLRENN